MFAFSHFSETTRSYFLSKDVSYIKLFVSFADKICLIYSNIICILNFLNPLSLHPNCCLQAPIIILILFFMGFWGFGEHAPQAPQPQQQQQCVGQRLVDQRSLLLLALGSPGPPVSPGHPVGVQVKADATAGAGAELQAGPGGVSRGRRPRSPGAGAGGGGAGSAAGVCAGCCRLHRCCASHQAAAGLAYERASCSSASPHCLG